MLSDEENGCAEISGNTLIVYFYILRKRQSCGVREIQRALGFSSSSTAHYHLEKLAHKGILSKDLYGNYKVNKNKKVDLTNPFLVVHHFVFPKQLIYAAATTIMYLFLVAMFWNSITLTVILALLPGIMASGIFWYDTARIWSRLPSFKNIVREFRGNVRMCRLMSVKKVRKYRQRCAKMIEAGLKPLFGFLLSTFLVVSLLILSSTVSGAPPDGRNKRCRSKFHHKHRHL